MVLAPHCDDETLASAGVILVAQRLGMEVKVVIATNGDGYVFATMDEFNLLYPNPADFIRMGNLRQQESLTALKVLGVNPEQVIFLSYPDQGTPFLWSDYWFGTNPYRSPYSGATRSPYRITYNPNSFYAGENYMADLISIIDTYRPDLIIYPHPEDVHADHWGLSAFTRLAVAVLERNDPDFRPDMYAYLVHRRDYPEPRGYLPKQDLLPPRRSYDIDPFWFRLDLTSQDVAKKDLAVNQYKSQLTWIGVLMESFIRVNENFAKPQPAILLTVNKATPNDPSTWLDNQGNRVTPIQRDPGRDFITREMVSAADLVALYAARDADNHLFVCAQVREETKGILIYDLQVVGIGEQKIVHHTASNQYLEPGGHPVEFNQQYVCDQVGLSELGDPWALFVGANVKAPGKGLLDQIAWQIVYLEPIPE